ncbi:hypothetical protein [Clostridium sp. CTA-6]
MKEYTYFLVDRNSSIDTGYCVEIIKVKSEDENKFYELFEEINNIYKESKLNGEVFRIIAKTQDLVQVYKEDFSDVYITTIQELTEEIIYNLQNLDEYVNKLLLENLCKIKFQNV